MNMALPQTQSTLTNGQITIQPHLNSMENNSAHQTSKTLGIVNLIAGVLVLIFGIVVTAKHEAKPSLRNWVSEMAVAIWTGAWIICTGAIGIAAGSKKLPALVGVNLGFNIVSSVLCGLDLIFFSVALAFYRQYISKRKPYACWQPGYHSSYNRRCLDRLQSQARLFTAMYSLLIVLAVMELIVTIIAATYACKSSPCVCCTTVQPAQVVVYKTDGTTLVPLAPNETLYFQPGVSRGPAVGGGYTQQVWATNAVSSTPATGATFTTGMQTSVMSQTAVRNMAPTVPGAVGGPIDAPPTYSEKAPVPN